jgi:splicing factor 45
LAEEKKKRDEGSGESSYYSDSEDEAPRRDGTSIQFDAMEEMLISAPKMWAPPTSIYGTQPKSVPPPPAIARPPSPPALLASGDDAYARRVAMSQVPTGDDAYARRQAMSHAPTGDDAYAQRQAMSRPPPDVHRPTQPTQAPPIAGPSWNQASGDEAYARRAALSQSQSQHATPSPLMPKFAPPAMMMMPPFPPPQATPQSMPPFAPSQQPPVLPPFPPSQSTSAQLPPSTIESSGIPGFGARPPPPMAAPTAADAEPALPTPAPPSAEDFARMLEERKKAAASIAERLKNLGPPPSAHPPIPEPEE